MKKILSLLFALILFTVSFTGCDKREDWQIFLEDFEATVEEMQDMYKEYEKNPNDQKIIDEYKKLGEKVDEFVAESYKIEEELADDEETLEKFSKELTRIMKKSLL